MELFRRKNSKCWWYDFMVRGERYRGSTKQTTKTAAQARAAQIFTELANGSAYRTGRKVPYLSEIGVRFLTFVDNAKLADKSKAYLRNGWRLLQGTNIPAMRMDHISPEDVNVIIMLRDTGMRPKKELFQLRIENLDWNSRVIFVPDSKTPTGRRYIPMSNRVLDLLMVRCAGRQEGWVFPAASPSGHITTIDKQFRKARADAGLPEGLKLYCGRHDFGTEMLQRTGNLALVMRVMGQTSTKAAMQYQHPDLEHIRAALNVARANPEQENRGN